ncbi:hypothetical protein CANINC_000731 [Pichia inconspicua]|uniref:Uncharacterized protein n=1 Tax=Pichia inconspicua TaxID=52247 RepID=A0A4T0X668_9ASCO|nr:hypothetical protein CANINC_000731 [[Candida] inconspicua]
MHRQSTTLSSKEKKYMANVEKALQSFESVDEWADYIAFLAKLQKALQTNPDKETTNWIPFDYQVSITLSKCISPSLPSGVHKKTIETYNTIFDILKVENLSKSITLWLPGILPLMLYASISIKQELLDFYNLYICSIEPVYLRSCFKAILMSVLPALDDTTSEFFDPTLQLIENLKSQLKDVKHFWQCMLLTIITSSDKRVGAMEYLSRKLPTFAIEISEGMTKETIISTLSPDAAACLTPESGLLVKAVYAAMLDQNLFVQRGFFDILLSKLPLNSAVFELLLTSSDKEDLLMCVTSTVLRKDMSLNRRLWNWLLGPESPADSENTTNRLEYFKAHGYEHLLNCLLKLTEIGDENIVSNFVKLCNILVSIMDKWEIGQLILPNLFISILKTSFWIFKNQPNEFENAIKASNKLFDGVETNVIWSNILKLIKSDDIDLVLLILQYYNVEDEEMVVTHIPVILLAALSLFKYELKWCQLIDGLLKLIPQRALLPLDTAPPELLSIDYYTEELSKSIVEKLNAYYAVDLNSLNDPNSESSRPFEARELAALYLGLMTNIILTSYDDQQSTIFMNITRIFDDLNQVIPFAKDKNWDLSSLSRRIESMAIPENDLELSFGLVNIFKYAIKDLSKLKTLKLLKVVIKSIWNCLSTSTEKSQVEVVEKFWSLELIVGPLYIEAALCELLLLMDFEKRLEQFNILWIHLNSDTNESRTILHKPLYIILDEMKNDIYMSPINNWIKSTNSAGSLSKIFRIVTMELFNNEFLGGSYKLTDLNKLDLNQISYDLEIIYNLLKIDEVLNSFKLELCVIDNDKQISFIKERNWDISTYKSFLINILNRFMEIEISEKLSKHDSVYENYLKSVRLSLQLMNLLIDGTELNFNEIFTSLVRNCKANCAKENTDVRTKTLTNSFYLETITKLIKLSIKSGNTTTIFDIKDGETMHSVNLLEFILTGIESCDDPVSYNNWIDLILITGDYYPDLTFQICSGLIDCLCQKLETRFITPMASSKINAADESVCEMILGIEKILVKCHKHLGYILSDTFGFSNISNSNAGKESGFFGSVIQGVFQVETENEKNEGIKLKHYLIKTFRRGIITVYQAWSVIESQNNKLKEFGKLDNTKTLSYCNSKAKFRCKKFIEQTYALEPLETIEAIIENHLSSQMETKFKIFNILDDSNQKIILPYIFDGIISYVNYSSLEENKRSSLISNLNENDLSNFLVEYTTKLKDNDSIDQVWPQIQTFLKDSISNPSYYKYIYPKILRFLCALHNKISSTVFGRQKRISKEISDSFIKLFNAVISIKISPTNNNSLPNAILQKSKERNEQSSESASNNATPTTITLTEKIIFREDVCIALKEVCPYLNDIVGDSDKTSTCFTTLISGLSSFLSKNGSLNFETIPEYIVDLLIRLSEIQPCIEIKSWKGLCHDIISDSGFFSIKPEKVGKWNVLMKNWISDDDSKLGDMINNKLIFSHGTTNTGNLLFNWNDEVDILNGNIPIIKRINYLILINDKDKFINFVGPLIKKIDDFIKAFRQMTKYCLLESWILILCRTIALKFSENHLTDFWTIVNKSMFYVFNETYQKAEESQTVEEDDTNDEKDETFNKVFLEQCKLLDVLVLLSNEDFQMSQWIFISDSMDGIFKSSADESDVGIVEKLSKSQKVLKSISAINTNVVDSDTKKKVPLLKGVSYVDSFKDLKRFFSMLKIKKYENDYEIKDIDYQSIINDLFADIFVV